MRAGNAVKAAIKRGELVPVKGQRCADCSRPADCYDHRDYLKPLEVAPVCGGCNGRRGRAANHGALGYDQRPMLRFTIEARMRTELVKIAKRERRTLNQQIAYVLNAGLERLQTEHATTPPNVPA